MAQGQPGQITDPKIASAFIVAGKATVTFRSLASGSRFTYKIIAAKKRNENDTPTWFVKLLNGPDNSRNFTYIGTIRNNQFFWTGKSHVSKDASSFIGFQFCYSHLVAGNMTGFEVWHEGKCGRCGKKLTVPESIASGFGPDCLGLAGLAAVEEVVATSGVAANLNFDGTVRQPKSEAVAVTGVAVTNEGELDSMIRARIVTYKSECPENYYQDGMLDETEAFNVAYNMFRVKIERENA
jgi:Family of unknown function (DUF6011)